jgi:hypothetical protein
LKLIKDGITNFLWNSLRTIQNNPLFCGYYLAGGTALSLQIGHRISDDIDLFTKNDLQKEEIFDFVKTNINEKVKVINNQGRIFQLLMEKEKLKIDFVQFPYDLLDPLIEIEGISLIGKKDLSAMKVSAAGTRGNEAKDFVDIYFLLREITIDTMFENFKKKFKTNDILQYVRSVMYFDDVTQASWAALKPILEMPSVKDIKEKLTQEVINYEKKLLKSDTGI